MLSNVSSSFIIFSLKNEELCLWNPHIVSGVLIFPHRNWTDLPACSKLLGDTVIEITKGNGNKVILKQNVRIHNYST